MFDGVRRASYHGGKKLLTAAARRTRKTAWMIENVRNGTLEPSIVRSPRMVRIFPMLCMNPALAARTKPRFRANAFNPPASIIQRDENATTAPKATKSSVS